FQVGGLGIMTLTTFFAFVMGGSSSLKEYASLRSMLGEENIGRIRRTVVRIALMTFVIELIGTIALYALTGTGLHANDGERLFFSMFHAVSAFCNAGFTIAAENIATQGIQSNFPFLGAVMALVVLGGLGFPVLSNIWAVLLRRPAGTGMRRLTVHSKLVLITSAVLLLIGAAGIAILEQDRSMEHFKTVELLFHSLFQSVCARTAGFNTVGVAALSAPTGMLLMLLMWIGASPGSTGGGIKTTSIALAVLNIRSLASGRTKVEVFKKRVSDLAIVRAFSTIILSVLFAATMFFLLVLIEDTPFRDLAFETVSALGTVGLSAGVTPELSPVGKGLLIVTMLAGRVGLFAFVLALTPRKSEGVYEYTEENVLVT
ncbi:MAG: ATPase, partial [Bacteroidetes bacterium]|nr:ATPase [Bacteroidota bacterium]